jgi:acylphosphatase
MVGNQTVKRGFRIYGRVQGVFFRVWTRDTGKSLGLGGTVRNRSDGSVEALVIGPESSVKELEARFWDGPPASKVEGVESFQTELKLDVGTFEILY